MRRMILRAGAALACLLASAGTVRAQSATGEQLLKTVAPCRLIDTRTHSQRLSANVVAKFDITGNLSAQGGSATGCGLSNVQSLLVSIVAVNPAAKGNMKAWATDQAEPGTSVINFLAATNVANQILVGARQDTVGDEVSFKASQATDLVADVVGYTVKAKIPRLVDAGGKIVGSYDASDQSVVIDAGGGLLYRLPGVRKSGPSCTSGACVYFDGFTCTGKSYIGTSQLPGQTSSAVVDDCTSTGDGNLYCPDPGAVVTSFLKLSSICCPVDPNQPPPSCSITGGSPQIGLPATAMTLSGLGITPPLHAEQ